MQALQDPAAGPSRDAPHASPTSHLTPPHGPLGAPVSRKKTPPPPVAVTPLVDTHCHVAFAAFDEDRDAVLARAREAGLVGLVAVSVDAASADAALALAEAEPGFVHPTAGVHPTEESCGAPGAFEAVSERLASGRFVAVGETGLDDYHDSVPLERQRESLDAHLRRALELDLPVILHCRDAFEPLIECLAPYRGAGLRGVLHCFTGEPHHVEPLLEAGLHIGIGGIATYKPRGDLRQVVRELPPDRLVLETDAPWLAPMPVRGRRNEPSYVAHVAHQLAADGQANGGTETVEALARRTTENARALFGIG